MSSALKPKNDNAAKAPPFASYAQVMRMLAPLVDKIGFYSTGGHALWLSDGVDEPQLRAHVEALLTSHAAGSIIDPPMLALPIRDRARRFLGVVGLVCRDAPTEIAQHRAGTIERLVAPLLDILAHSWEAPVEEPTRVEPVRAEPARADRIRVQQASAQPGRAERETTEPESAASDVLDVLVAPPPPTPAVIRRTLTLAVQRIECAFGAIVLADQPFTFSHRVSADESDLSVNAAIDTMRTHMVKLMQARRDPLIMNRASATSRKFLVHPVHSSDGRLAALIMLFRNPQGRDFVAWDVEALADIANELSGDVLRLGAPKPPEPEPASPPAVASAPVLTETAIQTPRRAPIAPQPLPMDARIRRALRENKFDLYAQKIAAVRSDAPSERFEVLLRMHDTDALCAPRVFFGAAHASHLMPELDRWVIRTLLQQLRERAPGLRSARREFCINIAAQSLASEAFSEFVVAEVCRSSIPPSRFVFEFAESHALEHQDEVENMAARLRDVGCRIALDNCAGVETLHTLRKWPVSCIKIDGSLIRDVAVNPRSEALVRAVVHLAHGAGIETVAECVESKAVHEKILDIGVDYAQGFHLSTPQPIERLL